MAYITTEYKNYTTYGRQIWIIVESCYEIARFLQENADVPYDFQDCIDYAASVNPFVEAYLGKPPVNNNNSKYRDIADRFKTGIVGGGLISIVNERPLTLIFRIGINSDLGSSKEGGVGESQQQQQQAQQQQSQQQNNNDNKDTIYRLGRSDTWACKNCRVRDDKFGMEHHVCSGSSVKKGVKNK